MSRPILEVSGLTMRFGGLLAVNGVNLKVEEKQVVSMIGPNGAGKTTVFNCLTGFYQPTGGPQRQRVADDQPGLVDVVAEIAAEGAVAQLDPQVLQRPRLHQVGDIGVPLPFLAAPTAVKKVDVFATQVAAHECQAGQADGGEIVVVAQLPGALVLVGEIADLHEVDQIRIGPGQVGETAVAGHALVAEAEGVAAQAIGEQRIQRAIVDAAAALVGGTRPADVGLQRLVIGERQEVLHAEIMLAVEILQVGVVVAAAQALAPAVGTAGEVEAVAAGVPARQYVALVAAGDAEVFGVGRVALLDLAQLAELQRQPVDLVHFQQSALEGLRVQARVVELHHRQPGHQGADLQRTVRDP
ncbi:hypothetical protein ACS96_29800 [Pseudomonas aeruginosa]|nr:hypothetical protein ACS96_29800 [Pseudomonas aeruginosa]